MEKNIRNTKHNVLSPVNIEFKLKTHTDRMDNQPPQSVNRIGNLMELLCDVDVDVSFDIRIAFHKNRINFQYQKLITATHGWPFRFVEEGRGGSAIPIRNWNRFALANDYWLLFRL